MSDETRKSWIFFFLFWIALMETILVGVVVHREIERIKAIGEEAFIV